MATLMLTTAGAAAAGLAYVLLRKCGPDIPRPEGWSAQKDKAPLAELPVTLADGKHRSIQLRHISWEQRSEVAHLLSRAHAFTAPWVRIFEAFSPPSIGAFDYAYTLEEQASASPACFADRDRRKKREAALAWTFDRNLSLFPSNDDLFVAVDAGTGEVVGFVALVRSSSYSLASKIRVGLLSFPFVWGMQAFIRLLRISDQLDAIEARSTRSLDPDHLRVERLAVDQRYQGHGVGRFLLREMQRVLDERGVPGFLMTQNERTARWYETLGWRLLPGSPEWLERKTSFPFRNWNMWRQCLNTTTSGADQALPRSAICNLAQGDCS
jgi:GNAT superfamily N-acetyltransferase